jgi:hypothetical protein
MLGFFKKLFGSAPTETPAPYKVEAPAAVVIPVAGLMLNVKDAGATEVVPTKKATAKKPAGVRKPRAVKVPKV